MNLAMNVYWACLSLTLALALGRGGKPEQLACLLLVAAAGASLASAPDPFSSFRRVEWDLFAVDMAGFVAFVLLSLRANRWWPMCIAGMRLVPVCAHLSKAVEPDISRAVYMWVTGAWGYPYMIVIVAGVIRHRQRLRRHGEDLAWRPATAG